ncbi:MAG: galactose mutarotase [Bacteroidales bacterium]|nr:galactose mutarotase [Bacteroidales bacterium]
MKAIFKTMMLAVAAAAMHACAPAPETTLSGLDPERFVAQVGDKTTALYTLVNPSGMEVCVTNFGGRIVSVMVPDRNGEMKDVVLGFDNVFNYIDKENTPSDFGASVGRYANRLNKGVVTIAGETIQLPVNNFGHCLHGGPEGWQYQVYSAEQKSDSVLVLTMDSPDGDSGFPGAVKAVVTMTVTSDNSIDIVYEAETDRTTVVNMTNHSYFNLSGDPSQPITDHVLYVDADTYTPVDDTYMTTGEIAEVEGTPMDFREAHEIGQDIRNFDFEQVKFGNGFDHNWCLNTNGDDTKVFAKVVCPSTGICLEVLTNEPGVQVYSGNFLDGTCVGKNGVTYEQHAGLCLETQKYPDSPNKPEWPSAVLEPGQKYYSHCVYRFSVVE